MKYYFFLTFLCTTYAEELMDSSEWEASKEECGKTRFRNKEPRSSAPGRAAIGQFPWVARIGYYWYKERFEKLKKTHQKSKKIDKELKFICGGSLVSKHYVISASKCGFSAQVVRVGENVLNSEVDCDECDFECAPAHQDVTVSRNIISETCSFDQPTDISILELKKAVELNDFVQPICLPKQPQIRTISTIPISNMNVIGWGTGKITRYFVTPKAQEKPINDIRFVNPNIVTNVECDVVYRRNLTTAQFCVGPPKAGACISDVGGGLAVHKQLDSEETTYYLAGVATRHTSGCFIAEPKPSVYTDVGQFSDWLLDTIKHAIEEKIKRDETEAQQNILTKVMETTLLLQRLLQTMGNLITTHKKELTVATAVS